MGRASALLKRLEVKPTDDEYEKIQTSRWGNRDVYPIAHDKRTYGIYAYVSYWGRVIENISEAVTKSCRHMRNMPFIMDHRKQSHRYWLDSRSSHDSYHCGHAHSICYSVPEWNARCKTPSRVRDAGQISIRPLGKLLLHHAERIPVLRLLCTHGHFETYHTDC